MEHLAKDYKVYSDGISDVSYVAETLTQDYGVPFQVPTPASKEIVYAADNTLPESSISQLQHKYAALCQADTIYVFGHLERNCKTLRGGTGWCVSRALDMKIKVYVYDIESATWFQNQNNRFRLLLDLPTLVRKSVLLGSKHIGAITNNEIQSLFQRTFKAQERLLEDFDL